MNTYRNTARVVGVLYIIGTISGILSLVFSDTIRNAPDLLEAVSSNQNQLLLGAVSILIMGLSLAMVPVMMFPVLRKVNEALALGYVLFRGGLEAVTYMAMAIAWMLLIPLSHIYIELGAYDNPRFKVLSDFLFNTEEIASVLNIVFCLGALMFYSALFKSKLVPRWLSGWGLIGLIPYLLAGLLAMFSVITTLSTNYVYMQMPLAVQEMVLAVWLIVKGFNTTAKT